MKFTKKDIAYLKNILCEDDVSIEQIGKAASKTKYYLSTPNSGNIEEKRISQKEAIKVLGREKFLSGLDRSAFHWGAVRLSSDERLLVYFDSSAFFKED